MVAVRAIGAVGSALPSHGRGHRFESGIAHHSPAKKPRRSGDRQAHGERATLNRGIVSVPVRRRPEHASLRALIPAWEAGLAKIITIPCRGEYTRVISTSALLMTEATRNQPELYTAALETFR